MRSHKRRQGGTSVSEALSGHYAYRDSVIPKYKSAISEALSNPSDYSIAEDVNTELNMTIPEMLEYFSMTELQ